VAVIEMKAKLNHEGWKAQRTDQEMVRKEINSRFRGLKKLFLAEMAERVKDVYFYPVYVLHLKDSGILSGYCSW
jgi:hypothetical protein